jgi:hypothetical protein
MKTYEELVEELSNNEEAIQRIEKITSQYYLVCIKNIYTIKTPVYDIRTFLENSKNPKYVFTKGQKYRIIKLQDSKLFIEGPSDDGSKTIMTYYFSVLGTYTNSTGYIEKDINEYFMLESEWLGLQRDKKIDEILN